MIIKDIYTEAKGHIEIHKVFKDGSRQLFYSDENVVCSGMGVTLAEVFSADIEDSIEDYLVSLFQIGNSGTGALQVSSNGKLGNSLTIGEYGTGNLELVTQNISASGVVTTGEAFGVIPYAFVDKVADDKVRWRIIIDENAGNGLVLNEIGLFSKNPSQTSPTATSFLCAYRNFNDISKTNEFALDIRWTITF